MHSFDFSFHWGCCTLRLLLNARISDSIGSAPYPGTQFDLSFTSPSAFYSEASLCLLFLILLLCSLLFYIVDCQLMQSLNSWQEVLLVSVVISMCKECCSSILSLPCYKPTDVVVPSQPFFFFVTVIVEKGCCNVCGTCLEKVLFPFSFSFHF